MTESKEEINNKYKELIINVTNDRRRIADLLDFLNTQMCLNKNNP